MFSYQLTLIRRVFKSFNTIVQSAHWETVRVQVVQCQRQLKLGDNTSTSSFSVFRCSAFFFFLFFLAALIAACWMLLSTDDFLLFLTGSSFSSSSVRSAKREDWMWTDMSENTFNYLRIDDGLDLFFSSSATRAVSETSAAGYWLCFALLFILHWTASITITRPRFLPSRSLAYLGVQFRIGLFIFA